MLTENTLVDELVLQTAEVVLHQEISRAADEPLETLALHTSLVAGVHYMHNRSNDLFELARTHFSGIVLKSPSHPTVHALLAQWYVLKLNRSGGWAQREDKRNKTNAMKHCEIALNSTLSYMEEGIDAVAAAERAFKLSPLDPQLHLFHTCAAAAHYAAGNVDDAERHANRGYSLNPHHTSNLRTLVAIQVDLGKISQARKSAEQLLFSDPGFTTSSYLAKFPNAAFPSGQRIALRLEEAGIPRY